jgi:uncharacterized iron-regulated membrane protein
MFEYLSTEAMAVLLAFGFLLALIVIAGVMGHRRRKDPNFVPGPVRFVPHWRMMTMLIVAAVAILAAILIPLIVRLLSP